MGEAWRNASGSTVLPDGESLREQEPDGKAGVGRTCQTQPCAAIAPALSAATPAWRNAATAAGSTARSSLLHQARKAFQSAAWSLTVSAAGRRGLAGVSSPGSASCSGGGRVLQRCGHRVPSPPLRPGRTLCRVPLVAPPGFASGSAVFPRLWHRHKGAVSVFRILYAR